MSRVITTLGVFVLWSLAAFGAGWAWRGDRSRAQVSQQQAMTAEAGLAQLQDARRIEHSESQRMADIGAGHENDRIVAASVPGAVAAAVRDGSLQLRDDLATCSTQLLSQAVAGAIERDASAQLRAEIAGDIVQAGRDADDQLRAAQQVILLRNQTRPQGPTGEWQ